MNNLVTTIETFLNRIWSFKFIIKYKIITKVNIGPFIRLTASSTSLLFSPGVTIDR